MATFVEMVTRIAREINRSNLTEDIKAAVNDAIEEAAANHLYVNEVVGLSFPTVIGQEYYSDQNLVDIEIAYYFQGTTRFNLVKESSWSANLRADGNAISGQLQSISRHDTRLRLYPLPTSVFTVFLDGYGKLTPWPLVLDADTNNWTTEGAAYIRLLAKRNLFRDRIRDYGEATAMEAAAQDALNILQEKTTTRVGTGEITPTQF